VLARQAESSTLAAKLAPKPGKPNWPEYQALCADIFDYLFSPPLKKGIRESRNISSVNRRDIITPNYAKKGFWLYVREKYWADHVVIDAKNYTSQVSKDQVLQLANYLSTHGLGRFGILATRNGASKSSQLVRREQTTN